MDYIFFMELIQKINFVLSHRNITGAKMSKDLGFANISFSHWQNGRSNISVDNLAKIADYLDVSVDYLLGRTDKPEINK
jgi:transcriptional regulator with XRE-family HTH domain